MRVAAAGLNGCRKRKIRNAVITNGRSRSETVCIYTGRFGLTRLIFFSPFSYCPRLYMADEAQGSGSSLAVGIKMDVKRIRIRSRWDFRDPRRNDASGNGRDERNIRCACVEALWWPERKQPLTQAVARERAHFEKHTQVQRDFRRKSGLTITISPVASGDRLS